jgi:hypothetical protein
MTARFEALPALHRPYPPLPRALWISDKNKSCATRVTGAAFSCRGGRKRLRIGAQVLEKQDELLQAMRPQGRCASRPNAVFGTRENRQETRPRKPQGQHESGPEARRRTGLRPVSRHAEGQWKCGPDPSLGTTEQRCGIEASALDPNQRSAPGRCDRSRTWLTRPPSRKRCALPRNGTDAGKAKRSMIAGPFGPPERLRRKAGHNVQAGRSVPGSLVERAAMPGKRDTRRHLATSQPKWQSPNRTLSQQARVGPGRKSGPHLLGGG